MEQESETAYKALRQGLTSSSGINTVDEFFRLDESKITTQLLLLGAEISKPLILLGTNILALYRGWVSNGYPTLERFALNHRVEPFKPLITVVLADEGKSNQDIFEFINEAFNRPPTPLPTSTLTNSSNQLPQFPPTPRQVWSSISSNNSTPLWNPTKVSSIKSAVKQSPNIQNSRTWQSKPTIRLEGINSTRKLDGAIMSLNLGNENHIRDVLVRVELKIKNKSEASHAAICLANSGSLSGAIGSESFDVKASKENLKKFFALISLSLTCNKRLLGFDPTFIDDQGPHTAIQIVTDTGTQELVIDHPHIFRAAGICGRGTTCWKAHLSVDERQTFLIKDSWQPKDRREEGVMLRDVTENNVPHVARYHHHEDVHVAGNSVDIESHVRRGANFQENNVPHVARYHHHQDVHVAGNSVDIESHVRRGANFQTCQTIKITDEPNDPHKYRMALLIGFTNG
ncbi:FunK1 1 [Puccinia graminis f. sp. tritici CRL 75-36-700-3]|uniref:FunK1 1 n=1 Tax=Puccinia graminis f. sp. tritici (strain CRL 75-36-700-3 / race SCCL) TaxID=418459 RepID=E3JR20_PUCGT|nr:FunK1 1 [Puccinia graminis f. sp. tritici CRL 75-36-700-3]EFP74328.2 FunK1 1 [Puccinia graminis f. sp. tritici CRL 75-36-700-3]